MDGFVVQGVSPDRVALFVQLAAEAAREAEKRGATGDLSASLVITWGRGSKLPITRPAGCQTPEKERERAIRVNPGMEYA